MRSRSHLDPVVKRAFDVAAAGVGFVIALPLMAVVAIVIRVDTKGPVIFRQERVGLNAATFRIHKFRSLRTDLPGGMISPAGDPRITRVGSWLRRTKVDELPQLYDVLTGHMSIVGPRPEVQKYVALWPTDARDIILSVRPGITDRASIAMRHEAEELAQASDPEDYYISTLLPRKIALYVSYVESMSFSGDLRIILETAAAVLRRPREADSSQLGRPSRLA